MTEATDPLPQLWLLSDARNDARLEAVLAKLPRGSGFVFRHYHLDEAERQARFARLRDLARAHGHRAILSGDAATAEEWRADGIYGPPARIAAAGRGLLKLAAAHNTAELEDAARAGAEAAFLSPVFETNSHPGAPALGAETFLALARAAPLPVIALGGVTPERASLLGWPRWGAIDGLY